MTTNGLIELASPILITVIDPRDPPSSLTPSPDATYAYIVTDPSQYETIIDFTTNPTFCSVSYSCDLTGTGLEDIVTFDSDSLQIEFQTDDLAISGSS